MAIQKTNCSCGVKVTVLSGDDAKGKNRADGKQVVYTDDEMKPVGWSYDIFRCKGCGEPISETCKEAAYGSEVSAETLQLDRKAKLLGLMREAEKVAYEYFCECDIGDERIRAHQVYENIRLSTMVGV